MFLTVIRETPMKKMVHFKKQLLTKFESTEDDYSSTSPSSLKSTGRDQEPSSGPMQDLPSPPQSRCLCYKLFVVITLQDKEVKMFLLNKPSQPCQEIVGWTETGCKGQAF